MAFLTWNDIKRLNDKRVARLQVTMRTDRIVFTPSGPVAVLRPGENFIEYTLLPEVPQEAFDYLDALEHFLNILTGA